MSLGERFKPLDEITAEALEFQERLANATRAVGGFRSSDVDGQSILCQLVARVFGLHQVALAFSAFDTGRSVGC